MPRRSEIPEPTPLADHLAWLESIGSKPCSCRFAWRSLSWVEPGPGRIRRSQGYGWVRQNTDPRCPEHGHGATAGAIPASGVVAEHEPPSAAQMVGYVAKRWGPDERP
jgi:hypothetical protein